MEEKRKKNRFNFYIPVYFPEHKSWGFTKDISYEGCGIKTNLILSEGILITMQMDIPVIGPITLTGYIQHFNEDKKETGFQFTLIKNDLSMAKDYEIYLQFVNSVCKL
jgi:hypothetical protein